MKLSCTRRASWRSLLNMLLHPGCICPPTHTPPGSPLAQVESDSPAEGAPPPPGGGLPLFTPATRAATRSRAFTNQQPQQATGRRGAMGRLLNLCSAALACLPPGFPFSESSETSGNLLLLPLLNPSFPHAPPLKSRSSRPSCSNRANRAPRPRPSSPRPPHDPRPGNGGAGAEGPAAGGRGGGRGGDRAPHGHRRRHRAGGRPRARASGGAAAAGVRGEEAAGRLEARGARWLRRGGPCNC